MIIKISKIIKKKVYHILTSGNADIAFYTDAYFTSNKEWIMKKPIVFAINLIKININCLIPHGNLTLKELLPGKKCIARIHRRPKVYQYSLGLMRFPCIITDIFGSLLELTIDFDSIYQKIEEKYNLPGFHKLRKKKENYYKPIARIYEEISRELEITISEAVEITMIKEHLILNPYLKKVFEIAAYNQTYIAGILETSYSKEDIEEILGEFSIKLSELHVSNEKKLSFHRMRSEFIHTYKSSVNEVKQEEFVIVSANYNKAIKHARRYHIAPRYYRSSKEIMKSIPFPNLTREFKEVYQTIAGIELFSGQYNHKNIYELTYLYIAPAIYALLEQTHQKATQSESKVIALCDPECMFSLLYTRYFGEINSCIWSGLAGAIPTTKDAWDKLIEDCYFIESYPADRIAHSLGFSFQKQLLKNCKEEFIAAAYSKARLRDKDVLKIYLKNYLRNEQKILVIDPMPGLSSLDCFCDYVHEMNPQLEIEDISMSQFLKMDAKELHILHQILQMDIPYVTGIYGEAPNGSNITNDVTPQLREITFTQPKFIDEIKKKIIYQAIDDYCKAFVAYQRKNKDLKIYPSDISAILTHSKEGLIQLEEVFGGYIE